MHPTLDFRLLVWTRQPSRHPQIKSDINYRIERLFRENGIEIPYPKQEFLLRHVGERGETVSFISFASFAGSKPFHTLTPHAPLRCAWG